MTNYRCNRSDKWMIICLAIMVVSLTAVCGASKTKLLRRDGVKADVTLQDLVKYGGLSTGVSEEAFKSFSKAKPTLFSRTNKALTFIQINERIENGDYWGAADSVAQFLGGELLAAYEKAGGMKLGSFVAAAQLYVAANDFIHDQFFIPQLVDDIYEVYGDHRRRGNDHAAAWNAVSAAKGLSPVLADVKKRVIYPRHDIKYQGGEDEKAARIVDGNAAGRRIKIAVRHVDKWKYPAHRDILIRHKGKNPRGEPRFRRVIDVELTGLNKNTQSDLLQDLMYQITRLNERHYRDDPGYMSTNDMKAVRTELERLLTQALNKDPTDGLHREAVEYVGKMLKLRYAREQLRRGGSQINNVGRRQMQVCAQALEEYAQKMENGGKDDADSATDRMAAERKAMVDAWTNYARRVLATSQWREQHRRILEEDIFPQKTRVNQKLFALLDEERTAHREFRAAFNRMSVYTRWGSPTMKEARKKVNPLLREVREAITDYRNPRKKDGSELGRPELVKLIARSTDRIEKIMLDPEMDEAPPYDPKYEGKKIRVLDNPQWNLRYFLLFKNGHIYLTGWYHTPAGRKIDYTSLPLARSVLRAPIAGLIAAPSGTGYHIYERERKPWQPPALGKLVVTRMRGAEVKTIHELRVQGGSFTLNPPIAGGPYWTMKYREYGPEAQGAQKSIHLP